jgi:hypothetical protein
MSTSLRTQSQRWPLRALAAAIAMTCIVAENCAQGSATDLAIESRPDKATLKHGDVLQVKLSRDVTASDGQIAICIGPLDLSQRTKAINARTYQVEPSASELPAAEQEVVVHLIRGSDWIDIGKFTIVVEGDGGGASSSKGFESRVMLNLKGQVHESVRGSTKPNARPQFQDLNIASALSFEGKSFGWDTKSAANLVGVSQRKEAPRFGSVGTNAEKIDLNDYKTEFTRGDAKFTLGHLSYGNHPLLINNRDSRGITLGYAIAPWIDVSGSAIRATSVVGFDDFFGLATVDHRIYATTLGIEAMPQKKGLLRAEVTLMDAKALPQSNVNSGQIPDAEQSRGLGVRVVSADPDGRWRGDIAWARSRYVNPPHPDLAQGSLLVPVKSETRDAYVADASYLLIKDAPWLGEKWKANLRAIARYEYAEPLFKSLGAQFIADQKLMRYGAEAKLGEVALNLIASEKNDNVNTIPTILKTGTYERMAQLTVPLPALFGTSEKPANVWPQIQWESKRIRQYTLRIPDGTNAKSSFWPDQLNYAHKGSLNWNYEPYTISYNVEIGEQDNRQPGRENADFLIHTHGLTIAWRASEKLTLNVGYNRSRNFSYEKSQTTYNNGGTFNAEWQASELWSVKSDFSKTIAYDSLREQYSNVLAAALQVARKFTIHPFDRKLPGQVFVRVAYANNRALDTAVKQVLDGKQWLVQTGLSLNF